MVKLKERFLLSKHIPLEKYDDYMKDKPLEQMIILDFITDRLKKDKSLKIVEFGAGTGRFTKLLLKLFPKSNLTLVEPDKECCLKLNKLKDKYPQLKIIQSDAEDFKSKSKFDILVMTTAFHHIRFQNKLRFLKSVRKLFNKNGMFLCGDNFIAEYNTIKEKDKVLIKSMEKWVRDAKKNDDIRELMMAQEMKKLVMGEDCGGEYFVCPSRFELYLKESKLKIKGKVNVTNTNPLDMENYFYLIMK